MTFHQFLPGCSRGDREAWRAFLSSYSPLALRLSSLYLPLAPPQLVAFWQEGLLALCSNDYERLRGFPQQAEREFLVDLRAFLLDSALPRLAPSHDATVPPAPTLETLAELFKGLPLFHQETVFLKLAGYSSASLEKVLKVDSTVAEKRLERLRPRYAALFERPGDKCLWPAAWLELTRSLRSAREEACASLRQLVRILDGQISWQEKTSIEEHMGGCLSCLEQWVALREVVCWLREAEPLPPEKISSLVSSLPFSEKPRQGKSLWKRLRGK